MAVGITKKSYNNMMNTGISSNIGGGGGGFGNYNNNNGSGGVVSTSGNFSGGHHHNHQHQQQQLQQNQLTRSLERILEDAHLSGELKLSGRKLKDFPKAAGKYNLSDTVIAGESFMHFKLIISFQVFY